MISDKMVEAAIKAWHNAIAQSAKEPVEPVEARRKRLMRAALEAALSVETAEPFAYAHPNGAIWRMDNYPAGMEFDKDGWFSLYAVPQPDKEPT